MNPKDSVTAIATIEYRVVRFAPVTLTFQELTDALALAYESGYAKGAQDHFEKCKERSI